ncbi:Swc7 [Kluyveromyces lactis]|nr:Swc7 [Kluyveromyces lactis]
MSTQNDSIALLLLQITLYHQQELAHADSSLSLDELLVEPIVDNIVVEKFTSHSMVQIYAPELAPLNIRSIKGLISDLFTNTNIQEPKNLITLANHYYSERLNYLQEEKIPELIQQMKEEYRKPAE